MFPYPPVEVNSPDLCIKDVYQKAQARIGVRNLF